MLFKSKQKLKREGIVVECVVVTATCLLHVLEFMQHEDLSETPLY